MQSDLIPALRQPAKRLKTETIRVGDFVYCRSRRYRDQLQLPEELALVIEIKRSNFKGLYANDKRAWLPREVIAKVQPEPGSSFLHKLHYLLRRVNAHECELVSDGGLHRLSARIDKIDLVVMDELRAFLGSALVSLVVIPEGMAFMTLETTWEEK